MSDQRKQITGSLNRESLFPRNMLESCIREVVLKKAEKVTKIQIFLFDLAFIKLTNYFLFFSVNQLMALEKEFFRCTSFLHSFFTTLSKRGSFPHCKYS